MNHGTRESNGTNAILNENEIFDTSSVSSQPQSVSSQVTQQPGVSSQGNMMAQPEASSQFAAVTSSQSGVQSAISSQQSDELAAFQSMPSFHAMDMGANGVDSHDAFAGSNNDTSSGWQNQDSDMVFQGSAAGRAVGADQTVVYEKTSSNMILGLVGAVVGALIGAALWIGIYQLGYIAGLAGAAIIGFSIKGYVMLGKSIDVKGVIFCAVLSIITIYFAHRVSFAIVYMRSMNEALGTQMSFKTTYTNLDQFMKTMDMTSKAMGSDNSVTMAYWRDLVIGYGLSAVVGIPMAIKMIARS